MKRLLIAMVYGALGLAFGARAQLVNISWTGSGVAAGVSLFGGLYANYNGSGAQYTATSTAGYVTITGNSTTGYGMGLAGQYTLVDNPDALNMAAFNGLSHGVSQGYLYDNQLNFNSASSVDFDGLLFIRSDGLVVNIYSAGGKTYLTGSDQAGFDPDDYLAGNLALSSVPNPLMPGPAIPEPATIIAGALMLLPLIVSALRILCNSDLTTQAPRTQRLLIG